MRRILLAATALLTLLFTSAIAGEGVNLRWSNCLGDFGVPNRNFACATNIGIHVLVGSFELGTPMSPVSGEEIVVDLITANPSLPAWWSFKNPGTCRATSLSVTSVLPATAVNCLDWAEGQAAGGLAAYNIGFPAPNRARILAALAVPQSALASLAAEQEYFSFNVVVNNLKTVGSGACPGCLVPANLVISSLKLTTPVGQNDRVLTNPTNSFDSHFATWQGGFPIATRRETWASVKALYR